MRQFFKDFGLGIRTAFSGLGFAFNNNMGHYIIYPLIITVALAWVGITGVEYAVDLVKEWVSDVLDLGISQEEPEGWWDLIVNYMSNAAGYLLHGVLWLIFYFVFHKTIKYVTLILMSPIMALISERTEEILTGNTYPFEWAQFMKDIWRGVLIAIRNFFVETGIIVLLWVVELLILSAVPPLGLIISPAFLVLSLLIGAYFWGFSTMDYTNERRRLTVSESVSFIRKYRGVAVGNGLIFVLLLEIPLIGAYLGPVFATLMCTVGATIAIHKRVDLTGKDNYYLKRTEPISPDLNG